MMSHGANHSHVRVERWRWLLYVAIAIAGAALTFAGARAQQKISEQSTFPKVLADYCAAWSSGNPENAARFYAKDGSLVFYHVAPLSYLACQDYAQGVRKEFFNANFE